MRIILPASEKDGSRAISLKFEGGTRPAATPQGQLPGKANYILGRDPSRWQLGLPTYRRILYPSVYRGIDVAYYGAQQQLEFDLIVSPGAEPRQIRLKLDGTQGLRLDPDGTLMVSSPSGELRLPSPAIYQETGGRRLAIAGRYVLLGDHEVGFRLGRYDRRKALTIDPAIAFASLLGGNSNTYGTGVAVDSSGNAYITGYTAATDFPIVNGVQAQVGGQYDGFVTKIDPTGTTLLYSTYIGGSGLERLFGIAVDSTGAAWLTGLSQSTDFPLKNAYQSTLNGFSNAILVKLDASGALQFSTYFGLSGGVAGQAVAVDSSGSAYVTGSVPSGGQVATTPGAYLTSSQGGADSFAAKFTASGALAYSTYLGGSGDDYANGIAVDQFGDAYITGYTTSPGFTNAPAGGAQTANHGGRDGFALKLNPLGANLAYFTFLGGSGTDTGNGVAVDADGNAYIAGYTNSTDFPVTTGVLQPAYGGGTEDGFLAKLNSSGSALAYSTYLGGSRMDSVMAVTVDGSGNAYVTGQTQSANFPTVQAIQTALSDSQSSTSLFQTTNLGSSWTPFDSKLPGIVVGILPDPQTEGVIVALTDSGVYRTTDGGATWTQTLATTPPPPFNGVLAGSISRSLADSQTIYLLAYGFAYRSADGGVTWDAGALLGDFLLGTTILADPLSSGIAYIGLNIGTLYKTTDGGGTWNPLSTGLHTMFGLPPSSFIASTDGSLYMDGEGGVYKSTNQGITWVSVLSFANTVNGFSNSLVVSPSNPLSLYRAAVGIFYKSMDGGTTWNSIPSSPGLPGGLAVSPGNSSTLLQVIQQVATAYPPVVYVSTDGGTTWLPAANGLGFAFPTMVAFDPVNTDTAYVVANPIAASPFVAEVDSMGETLVYSTYLGGIGPGEDYSESTGAGIAAFQGDVFVAGTGSRNFPGTTVFQNSEYLPEAFIARITGATAPCTYTVSPLTLVVYEVPIFINVSAPSGCSWTAASNQPWAVIAAGASGSGAGTVIVQLTSGAYTQGLTATLTVAGQQVTLELIGQSCAYSFASGSSYQVSADGGPVTVSLSASAGCPWTVVNNYPFAMTVVSGISGTGSATINLAVSPFQAQQSRIFSVPIAIGTVQITQSGTSLCDLNGYGRTNVSDVQSSINEALGGVSTLHDLNQDGVVNIADVELVVNSALQLGCWAK